MFPKQIKKNLDEIYLALRRKKNMFQKSMNCHPQSAVLLLIVITIIKNIINEVPFLTTFQRAFPLFTTLITNTQYTSLTDTLSQAYI